MVPYKSSGGIISNHAVEFEVTHADGIYTAIPQLNEEQRRIANLPQQLMFKLDHGRANSLRGAKDGNQHVIDAIRAKLKEESV